ncbi:ead/Ea22-like family protein [Cronobacter malonaticus]|uniref:ead/Ea22-like family protein n=1 Tax=Cronobacter malonaticus TaxID=413503 RepID=UPI000CFE1FBE|nr:ead/Ea22-like family protein [Cronobacter malonaticus]
MNTAKLEAAAEKATPGPWRRASTIFNGITCGPFSLTNEKVLANVAEKANAEFIAAANPAAVLELIAALEAAREDCRENAARIAELESQRKLAFSACNRWADKCREAEKRVAEIEASHKKLREALAAIHNTIRMDGLNAPLAAIMSSAKRTHEESATAEGINLETGGEA